MTEPLKPNVYAKICPSRQVLAFIGEKWTSLIIGALACEKVGEKNLRFGELKRICEGVSQKMLTQTLRGMERNGLVKREVFAEKLPLRVDYSLTAMGISLIPIVNQAKRWAEENLKTIEAHQQRYDSLTDETKSA